MLSFHRTYIHADKTTRNPLIHVLYQDMVKLTQTKIILFTSISSQVPIFEPGAATGAPCEYLHSLHAIQFSRSTLFSNVQNLHDQNLYLSLTSLGFSAPHTSHTGARGCDTQMSVPQGRRHR